MGKHWVYVLRNLELDETMDTIYIGETKRLYRRFKEHLTGKGGKNTCTFGNDVLLVGLYHIPSNQLFEEFHTANTLSNYMSTDQLTLNIDQTSVNKQTPNSDEKNPSNKKSAKSRTSDIINPSKCVQDWAKKLRFQGKYKWDYHSIENFFTECYLALYKSKPIEVRGGKYVKDTSYKDIDVSYPSHRPLCKCGAPAEVFLSKKGEIWFKCSIANTSWVEFTHPSFSMKEPCDFLEKYTTF